MNQVSESVVVMEPDDLDWTTVVEASWERARILAGNAKANILELGAVLRALHDTWYRTNQGTRTDLHPVPAAHIKQGWREKVREELGISDDTALRIMEQGRYATMLQEISAGRAISYRPHKADAPVVVHPTPKRQEMATALLNRVLIGDIKASAGWSGLIGETTRADMMDGKKMPTDHANNLLTAIKKLKTSLAHWSKLTAAQRCAVENEWDAVRKLLPETW